MSSSFHNKLKHYVNDVDDVTALHALFRCIPLQTIKQLIINEIDQLAPSTAKATCFNVLPIDDSLPAEIIQHCLSLNRLQHSTRLVSKSWNQHFARNERIYLRSIYDRDFILNENETNKHRTIVVHPKRVQLHAVESKLGFVGPMTFENALKQCKDGDRILLHAGKYKYPNVYYQRTVSHIQLIGVEKNVKLYGRGQRGYAFACAFEKANPVYFENLEFMGSLRIANQKAEFKKCQFSPNVDNGEGIVVFNHSCVIVDGCSFTDVHRAVHVIDQDNTKISIVNSHFWQSAAHPNRVFSHDAIIVIWEMMHGDSALNLTLVGNKFVNCTVAPISAFTEDIESVGGRNYCLENNVFCTYNDTDGEQESSAYDANKVYRKLRVHSLPFLVIDRRSTRAVV